MLNRLVLLSVLLGALVVPALASFDGPAELPRFSPNAGPASTPANEGVVPVAAGSNLQTALNNAKCGQKLQLAPGALFVGNFVMPNKGCDDAHWIWLSTSSPDGVNGMPSAGTRITPCRAGIVSLPGRPKYSCANPQHLMATISGTIQWAAGANHYRLGPGLEITRQAAHGINFGLIVPTAKAPFDHIVIDRNWIHGNAQDDTTRGIMLSGGTAISIIDNYMNDFHCAATIGVCVDSQSIAGGTGPLPSGQWFIARNFLEAAAETILFGGTLSHSATPTDIIIRKNHMFKPLTWMPGQSDFVGAPNSDTTKCKNTPGYCPFIVKNLFELKNAQRVLLEGNILEHSWPGYTQHGAGMLISGLNPPAAAGAPVYSEVSVVDATFRYNRVAHTTAGMSIVNMGIGTVLGWNLPVARVSIHDNTLDDMSLDYLNSDDSPYTDFHMFAIGSCPACVPIKDISIRHNTILSKNPKVAFLLDVAGTQSMGLTFTDNIISVPAGTVVSGGNATGCAYSGNTNLLRLNSCLLPNYQFNGNVLIGATNTWPVDNTLLVMPSDVGFTNYNDGNGGDYSLQPTSPYVGKATDGKNPGADVLWLNRVIEGVY